MLTDRDCLKDKNKAGLALNETSVDNYFPPHLSRVSKSNLIG
jgi:hypothetical protein